MKEKALKDVTRKRVGQLLIGWFLCLLHKTNRYFFFYKFIFGKKKKKSIIVWCFLLCLLEERGIQSFYFLCYLLTIYGVSSMSYDVLHCRTDKEPASYTFSLVICWVLIITFVRKIIKFLSILTLKMFINWGCGNRYNWFFF